MRRKQKELFSQLITKKKEEARRRYASRRAELGDLSTKVVGDFGDEAFRNNALVTENALAEQEFIQYRFLEEAERRLESGNFGCCQVCGEPIEVSRLLAMPETSICYACSQDIELSRKRYHHLYGHEQSRLGSGSEIIEIE